MTFLKTIPIILKIARNWYSYYEKILTIIGNIKVFKTPCFVQYMPDEFDYKVRGEDIEKLMSLIKPGDIVLRRYDHYLDSFLIPGPYSHSSVYIGDNKIIHAVAEGVKEIHLIDFCQCDGLLVLRPSRGQEQAIERVKTWVGREYDFRFNSIDSSEFYCHELTASAYKGSIEIQKLPATFFGKELKFIKPKFLAESFMTNSEFEKVFELEF